MVGSVYFLFVSVSCLLLYVAPFLWPLVILAQAGTLLTLYHKRWGFYLGSCALLLYGIFEYERLCLQSFMFYFLASLGVSWLIEYLKQKDQEDRIHRILELEGLLEREKLESNRWMKESATLDQRIQRLETEKDAWELKQLKLSQEIRKLQEKSSPIEASTQVVVNRSENLSLEAEHTLLKHSHQQLKIQFEEKSQVLRQTRRDYFSLETQFLAMIKARQEEGLLGGEDLYQILQESYRGLLAQEEEIQDLEEILKRALSSEKPKRTTRSRKKPQLALDLLEDLR